MKFNIFSSPCNQCLVSTTCEVMCERYDKYVRTFFSSRIKILLLLLFIVVNCSVSALISIFIVLHMKLNTIHHILVTVAIVSPVIIINMFLQKMYFKKYSEHYAKHFDKNVQTELNKI